VFYAAKLQYIPYLPAGLFAVIVVWAVQVHAVLVMTSGAALHQRASTRSVTPPPPGGGPLLTFCCAFAACTCFQVTPYLHIAHPVSLFA
jgi:hypothetical protein